jgi:hypothetical protein
MGGNRTTLATMSLGSNFTIGNINPRIGNAKLGGRIRTSAADHVVPVKEFSGVIGALETNCEPFVPVGRTR